MINLDEVIYNTPHNGRAFDSDNKEFHRILDELTLGTDAAGWVNTRRRMYDVHIAWISLTGHYNGTAEGDKRVAVAQASIYKSF